jgi:hypothetical protein
LTRPCPEGPMLSHSPLNVEPEPGSNNNKVLHYTDRIRRRLPIEMYVIPFLSKRHST